MRDMVESLALILLISVSESIECCCFSQRSKYWAENTASIPSRVLEQTYITAVAQAPASISLKVSKEKEEKVVKPPRPTIRQSVIAGFLQLKYAVLNILTLFLPCRKGKY